MLPNSQPARPQSCASRFWPHTHLLGMPVLLLMVMLCCQLGASRNYSSQPGAGVLLHPAARSSMGCSSLPATVGQGALMPACCPVLLTPFGDSQCLAGSPANARSCVRGWQSPPRGAALGPSDGTPQHHSCSVGQATTSLLGDRWDIPVCHWGSGAHQDFADNVCCAGNVGDPLHITSTSVITRQG